MDYKISTGDNPKQSRHIPFYPSIIATKSKKNVKIDLVIR